MDLSKLKALHARTTESKWMAAGPSFGAARPAYLNEIIALDKGGNEDHKICTAPEGWPAEHWPEQSANMQFIEEVHAAFPDMVALIERQEAELRIERARAPDANSNSPEFDGIKTRPAAEAEPEKLNTEQSREYLVSFMERHFIDKTFHRYIRGQRVNVNLAGDFAWQMARALRLIFAAAAPSATAVIPLGQCSMCNGHGLVGRMTAEGGEGWPCPDCEARATPAPAMGEEPVCSSKTARTGDQNNLMLMGEKLPPLPEALDSIEDDYAYTADQMHAYGRACMALRQPAAGKAVALTDAQIAKETRDWIGSLKGALDAGAAYQRGMKHARDILATAPVSPPAAPEGWREFIEQCSGFAGGMVNGNQLARKASGLLAAAPAAPAAAPWSRYVESETISLNMSFAADLLGALFWGGTINPEGFERVKQAFSAIMRGERPVAPTAAPSGWVLVPNADNMTGAQGEAIAGVLPCCGGIAHSIYQAALAAAPARPERQDRSPMDQVADAAVAARQLAERHGMVLTVRQEPRTPLAMGNYETVVAVRLARGAP
ncbi:MAG: hypothetical protein V4724_26930 [Pseudomonadota bacterium]